MLSKIKDIVQVVPFFILIAIFFCCHKCDSVDYSSHQYRPTQTYQCNFHDKPLVMVGFAGNTSIRRYTMKDMESGIEISGVQHYARKCVELPLLWEEGAESKVDKIMKESYSWAKLSVLLIFLLLITICSMDYVLDFIEEKELET